MRSSLRGVFSSSEGDAKLLQCPCTSFYLCGWRMSLVVISICEFQKVEWSPPRSQTQQPGKQETGLGCHCNSKNDFKRSARLYVRDGGQFSINNIPYPSQGGSWCAGAKKEAIPEKDTSKSLHGVGEKHFIDTAGMWRNVLWSDETKIELFGRHSKHPCNYRPISLFLIISKVMESIIASDIKSFLFSNGLISDHQFGFRPDHSNLDIVLLLSKQWMEVLNARHEISHIPRHTACFWHGLVPCPTHQTLFLWYPRPSPFMARRLPLLSQPTCGPKWSSLFPSSCPGWSSSRQHSGPCYCHPLFEENGGY